MKKWGYHCAMLLYVCMGTAGILLAITNTFQLKYQKAEVFSIILLFLRNRDSSFVDGKEEWKGSCVECFDWKCFAFVSVKGRNSAGVIVVYQKKRSGNS
mgnify:CR=1 FL=1